MLDENKICTERSQRVGIARNFHFLPYSAQKPNVPKSKKNKKYQKEEEWSQGRRVLGDALNGPKAGDWWNKQLQILMGRWNSGTWWKRNQNIMAGSFDDKRNNPAMSKRGWKQLTKGYQFELNKLQGTKGRIEIYFYLPGDNLLPVYPSSL